MVSPSRPMAGALGVMGARSCSQIRCGISLWHMAPPLAWLSLSQGRAGKGMAGLGWAG